MASGDWSLIGGVGAVEGVPLGNGDGVICGDGDRRGYGIIVGIGLGGGDNVGDGVGIGAGDMVGPGNGFGPDGSGIDGAWKAVSATAAPAIIRNFCIAPLL